MMNGLKVDWFIISCLLIFLSLIYLRFSRNWLGVLVLLSGIFVSVFLVKEITKVSLEPKVYYLVLAIGFGFLFPEIIQAIRAIIEGFWHWILAQLRQPRISISLILLIGGIFLYKYDQKQFWLALQGLLTTAIIAFGFYVMLSPLRRGRRR